MLHVQHLHPHILVPIHMQMYLHAYTCRSHKHVWEGENTWWSWLEQRAIMQLEGGWLSPGRASSCHLPISKLTLLPSPMTLNSMFSYGWHQEMALLEARFLRPGILISPMFCFVSDRSDSKHLLGERVDRRWQRLWPETPKAKFQK